MAKLTSSILAGLLAAYAGNYLYAAGDTTLFGSDSDRSQAAAIAPAHIGKGDKLPILATADASNSRVSTVEIIGVRDTALVYRDRDGRVLFQTDPLANVTIVTKGAVLPQVTVREGTRSATSPVTINVPSGATTGLTKPTPPLVGCDPIASPLADPAFARIPGKCLSDASGIRHYASAE